MRGLMLVGGGPSSTVDGIKVTTGIVLGLAMLAFFRRQEMLNIFGCNLDVSEIMNDPALTAFFIFLATQPTRHRLRSLDWRSRVGSLSHISVIGSVKMLCFTANVRFGEAAPQHRDRLRLTVVGLSPTSSSGRFGLCSLQGL